MLKTSYIVRTTYKHIKYYKRIAHVKKLRKKSITSKIL